MTSLFVLCGLDDGGGEGRGLGVRRKREKDSRPSPLPPKCVSFIQSDDVRLSLYASRARARSPTMISRHTERR
jgi:hypothetical protein